MSALEKSKPVIFCGDLNVAHTTDDLANPKQNIGSAFAPAFAMGSGEAKKALAKQGKKGFTDEEREGIDNIIKAGFIDTFRIFTQGNGHYTWWSHFAHARERNVGWRIDYFFVSERLVERLKAVEILDHILGSDHCPVRIVLKDK